MQNQVVRRKQQQGGYRPDLEEGGSKWLLWRRHREEAVMRDSERKVPLQKREYLWSYKPLEYPSVLTRIRVQSDPPKPYVLYVRFQQKFPTLVLLTLGFDIYQGRNSRGYREASPPPVFDWRGKNTSQASSVGWGRRIYDQGEIEVEDKKYLF